MLRQGSGSIRCAGLHSPHAQPKYEEINPYKLKVDKPGMGPYMKLIEICLLSFGYRASGTAP